MGVIVSPYMQKQRALNKQLEDAYTEGYGKGLGQGYENGCNFMLDYIKREIVGKHADCLIKDIERLIKENLEASIKEYAEKKEVADGSTKS